jgi:hypothetical protein
MNVDKLVAATGAYAVRVPKNSAAGFPPGKGRSAAYGSGLLLTGFAKGREPTSFTPYGVSAP